MVQTDEDGVEEGVYQDESIASTKWVEKYNEGQKGVIQLESELSYCLSCPLLLQRVQHSCLLISIIKMRFSYQFCSVHFSSLECKNIFYNYNCNILESDIYTVSLE